MEATPRQPLRVPHVHRPARGPGPGGQRVQVPAGRGDHHRPRIALDDLRQRPRLALARRGDEDDVLLGRHPQPPVILGPADQHRGLRRAQPPRPERQGRPGSPGPAGRCSPAPPQPQLEQGGVPGAGVQPQPQPQPHVPHAVAGQPPLRPHRPPPEQHHSYGGGHAGQLQPVQPGQPAHRQQHRDGRRDEHRHRGAGLAGLAARPPGGQLAFHSPSSSGLVSPGAACSSRTWRTSSRRAVPGL